MGDEWRTSTWGEEISLEYGKALRGHDVSQGPYRVFGANGPIGWTFEPLAEGPGVILGRKGAYRGVRYSPEPFFVIDTAYYVVPKRELDMRWLYYAIQHYKLGEVDDGSPIPSTTRAAVYALELDVPPISEQRAIAQILGILDDKIELNRRMNETLEAMARALFKSWFIDFDPVRAKAEGRDPGLPKEIADLFPDSFDDSELGEIPTGWEVTHLLQVTKQITKGTTPTQNDINAAPVSDAQVNYLRVNAIGEDRSILYDKIAKIPKTVHNGVLKRSILQANDVVYTIAGTIGRIAVIEEDFLPANTNQAVAIIRPKPDMVLPAFLVLTMTEQTFQEELHSNVVQAVQANLSLGMISQARVVFPPRCRFAKLFEPIDNIMDGVLSNRRESRTLTALRDALLPRLLSGQVRLKEGAQLITEAHP